MDLLKYLFIRKLEKSWVRLKRIALNWKFRKSGSQMIIIVISISAKTDKISLFWTFTIRTHHFLYFSMFRSSYFVIFVCNKEFRIIKNEMRKRYRRLIEKTSTRSQRKRMSSDYYRAPCHLSLSPNIFRKWKNYPQNYWFIFYPSLHETDIGRIVTKTQTKTVTKIKKLKLKYTFDATATAAILLRKR